MTFTREEKHAEAKREVAMRRRVYKDRVDREWMTREDADRKIAIMEAIAADYAPAPAPDLFSIVQERTEV